MASRFGAAHQAQAAQTRMRFAMGLLVLMIIILFGSLVFLLSKMTNQETGPTPVNTVSGPTGPAPNQPIVPTVEVVIAAARIEEGNQIVPELLTIKQEEQQKVPGGAVLGREKDQILKMYAVQPINDRQVILRDYLSPFPPLSALKIEPGYRAVTITVDARSGVEGWAKPGTKVDVNWTFEQGGQKKVATILRQVEVLSYGGAKKTEGERVQVGGGTNVTLKVTEDDSRKIELARTLGELSLVLVSNEEPERQKEDRPKTITINEIIGEQVPVQQSQTGQVAQPVEEDVQGVMYATDPETGEQVKYVLIKGKRGWQRAAGW